MMAKYLKKIALNTPLASFSMERKEYRTKIMSMAAKQDFLLNHPFFSGCRPIDLARLIPHIKAKQLTDNEYLYRDGEDANYIYLVANGSLRLVAQDTETEITGILGEESLLGLESYSGDAIAKGDCRLWLLPRQHLLTLAENHTETRQRATTSLAQRFSEQPSTFSTIPSPIKPGGSWRELCGWLMATIVPLLTLYLLRNDPLLPSMHARYYMAILSSVAIMWIFRLLPDFIPVLFALLALIIFGVAPPARILSGFGSDGFFMAMSVLGLGTVIRLSGLGFRVLLLLIGIRPKSSWWRNFSIFLVGLILTPIIPSANGRINIISSFVDELLGDNNPQQRLQESARLAISALAGASIFSAIFLSSKSINFLMYGYLPAQEQMRFQWTYWLFAASITGIALLAMYLLAWTFFFRSQTKPTICRATIRSQLKVLGKLSAAETAALGGLLVFAASLATSAIHRIEIPWIALSILFGLLMFGFLERDAFRRNIDWSFLFFLGGLIGMIRTMRDVGVDIWLASHCNWLNCYMISNIHTFILLLALVLFVVRLVLPINATAVIFMTLLMPAAAANGVNPWLIGFMILFLAETFIFPYQASYYLQFCSLTGYGLPSQDRRIIPFNLLIMLMKIAALYISLPWWRHLGIL